MSIHRCVFAITGADRHRAAIGLHNYLRYVSGVETVITGGTRAKPIVELLEQRQPIIIHSLPFTKCSEIYNYHQQIRAFNYGSWVLLANDGDDDSLLEDCAWIDGRMNINNRLCFDRIDTILARRLEKDIYDMHYP